jgi:manganese transport protein
MHPVVRRLVTRGLAIIPAVVVLGIAGEDGLMSLLIGSQIVLSLQLAFAVVPLIRLTSSREIMGDYANGARTRWFASACAALIVVANIAWLARLCHQLWETQAFLAGVLATLAIASLLMIARVATVPLRSGTSVAMKPSWP